MAEVEKPLKEVKGVRRLQRKFVDRGYKLVTYRSVVSSARDEGDSSLGMNYTNFNH